MNISEKIKQWLDTDIDSFIKSVKPSDIPHILAKPRLSEYDFLALLSDTARPYLEEMARKARELTIHHFGRVIQLYIPLYLSNYCSNECLYCGFRKSNQIPRRKMTLSEIESNAQKIHDMGMRNILLLTGESPRQTPIAYLEEAVRIMKKFFSSIAIEIHPLDTKDYITLARAGVDSLTVYQEVYDRDIYKQVHVSGRKRDYDYRLHTPERGAKAGFRAINIGPLFGLGEPVREGFIAGIHARMLQIAYPEIEVSLSLPRINTAEGDFQPRYTLDDVKMVQFILAYRIYMPVVGINISTRESADFRDHLIPLGTTKMSAASRTEVGGYQNSERKDIGQFELHDKRSVEEVAAVIEQHGYEAVFKDWEILV